MTDPAKSTEYPSRPITRLRHRARRMIIGFFLAFSAMVLVWFLPAIVANSSLRDRLLQDALSGFDGTVSIGQISAGWFKPVTIAEIQVVDTDGQALAEVQAVRSEKSLISLLWNQAQPGVFHIEQPTIHVVVRDQGSNWEDAVAAMLGEPASDRSLDSVSVEILGGVLEVVDVQAAATWRLESLDAKLRYSPRSESPLAIRVTGQLRTPGQPAGTVSMQLDYRPGGRGGSGIGEGQAELHLVTMPLETVRAVARRAGQDIQVQGQLNCDAMVLWSANGGRARLELERLEARSFHLTAPALLGNDSLQAEFLTAQGTLENTGGMWQTKQFDLETDFAKLQLRGAVSSDEIALTGTNPDGIRLLQQDLQVFGEVSLPKLAAMLPETLRIRPSTTIQQGQVRLVIETQADPEPRLNARVETANLVAMDGSQRFELSEPIRLNAVLRDSTDGPVIEQLTWDSAAFHLVAQGALRQGQATVDGDLTALAAEFGQFIDLGGMQLSGQLNGHLNWNTANTQTLNAQAEATLRNFVFSRPGGLPWTERELIVTLNSSGTIGGGQLRRIDSATATLSSGSDRLSAELARPVAAPLAAAEWPVHARAAGNLRTWRERLQPLFSLRECELSGELDAYLDAVLSAKTVKAATVQLQLTDLKFDTDDVRTSLAVVASDTVTAGNSGALALHLNEPTVRLEAHAAWDAVVRQLTLGQATLTSSTVACRTDRIVAQFGKNAPALDGQIAFRADLGRVQQALASPSRPPQEFWTGKLSGTLTAAHRDGATLLDGSAEATDLVYLSRSADAAGRLGNWKEVWREAKITLTGRQQYDHAADRLTINALSLDSDTASIVLRGTIEKAWSSPVASLEGQADYDLARLGRRFERYWGDHVKLAGRRRGRFQLSGPLKAQATVADQPQPLISPRLAGEIVFGWDQINVDGLLVGQAEVTSTLSDGTVHIGPLDVPISGGRLTASPHVEMNARPAALTVNAGPVLRQVQISPEMCDNWLKYVAPLVAQATRSRGSFSLRLDAARLPLAEPRKSDVAGNLLIHSAQVGPGPLAKQYIGLALQIRSILKGQPISGGNALNQPWLMLPEQDARFEIRDGRVFHHNLVMYVQDVEIRTSGSVGLDESLDLNAEVPIRDEWIAGNPLLASMRGQKIVIPVRGTFSRPDIDERAIRELGRNFLRGAAGSLLPPEVGQGLQGLQGLFGPR